MYIDTLRRLRDAIRRKRPEKWRKHSWFLLDNNAPAHRPVSVKDILPNDNATTLEHPPYSPDLAAG
jgi:transposase